MQGYNFRLPQGFTLFDLLVSLLIVGILTGIAVPTLSDFIDKQRADEVSQGLAAQMRAARELAVVSGKTTLICGTNDGNTCSKDSFSQLMVFIDEDDNHQRNNDEVHLNLRSFDTTAGSLRLAASLGRKYLKYTPEGYANPYGSFFYCPRNSAKRQFIQRISTSRLGRTYIAEPSPEYGEVRKEGASKEAIDCP